jgi:hypothetical protein
MVSHRAPEAQAPEQVAIDWLSVLEVSSAVIAEKQFLAAVMAPQLPYRLRHQFLLFIVSLGSQSFLILQMQQHSQSLCFQPSVPNFQLKQ